MIKSMLHKINIFTYLKIRKMKKYINIKIIYNAGKEYEKT